MVKFKIFFIFFDLKIFCSFLMLILFFLVFRLKDETHFVGVIKLKKEFSEFKIE